MTTSNTTGDLKVKYRPVRFDQIVGQDTFAERFRAWSSNGAPNANGILLSGTRGTGKTTLARLLAAGLNCLDLGDDGEPCGKCRTCRSILSGNGESPAVQEIDCPSLGGVDGARNLVRSLRVNVAADVRWRVIIFDEAHKLSPAAMSVLLKPVEEPSAGIFFAFCTTEPEKLDNALVTRMQHFRLHDIDRGAIATQITDIAKREDIELTDDDLERIVGAAGGSSRLAIGNLMNIRDGLPVADPYVGIDIIEALVENNIGRALAAVKVAEGNGVLDAATACEEVQRFYGDALAVRFKPELGDVLTRNRSVAYSDLVEEAANTADITQSELVRGASAMAHALASINSSGSTVAQLEAAIVKILSPEEEAVARRFVQLIEDTLDDSDGQVTINVTNIAAGQSTSRTKGAEKASSDDDPFGSTDTTAGDNWPSTDDGTEDASDDDGESADASAENFTDEEEVDPDSADDTDDSDDATEEPDTDESERSDDDLGEIEEEEVDDLDVSQDESDSDEDAVGEESEETEAPEEESENQDEKVSARIREFAAATNSKMLPERFDNADMRFEQEEGDDPVIFWTVELAAPVRNKRQFKRMETICRAALNDCGIADDVEIDIFCPDDDEDDDGE